MSTHGGLYCAVSFLAIVLSSQSLSGCAGALRCDSDGAGHQEKCSKRPVNLANGTSAHGARVVIAVESEVTRGPVESAIISIDVAGNPRGQLGGEVGSEEALPQVFQVAMGRFELGNLTHGLDYIVVVAPEAPTGRTEYSPAIREFRAHHGETISVVLPRALSIIGRVEGLTDLGSAGGGRATIYALKEVAQDAVPQFLAGDAGDGESVRGQIFRNGAFFISGVSEGKYRLLVLHIDSLGNPSTTLYRESVEAGCTKVLLKLAGND